MTAPDIKAAKAAARKEALARRDAALAGAGGQPATATGHLLAAMERFRGRVISAYLPMRSELDPLPAMAELSRHGPVVVPVMQAMGQPLTFRRWTPGCRLEPHGFGTMVPAEGEEMDPEALICPMVAFDRQGFRLGYGGGFYDRTLARLRGQGGAAHAIGFAWAAQELPAVPVEPTDIRLDMVVTEQGVAVGG